MIPRYMKYNNELDEAIMNIGIDAGGTLIKIAYMQDDTLQLIKFPVTQMEQAASWITDITNAASIRITGGKAGKLKPLLNREVLDLVEFAATSRGVQYLLSKDKNRHSDFILTNVGTGTSIHYLHNEEHTRIGGTGVGGGALMGLSQLLTGITDYETIIQLAAKGDRSTIDLKVSHIYEGSEPPIPGDLTASNFGNVLNKAAAYKNEDLLATVVGLVGETVATTSVFAAAQFGVKQIVFIGSTFIENPLLMEVVAGYTQLRGADPYFLDHGEYSGAIGALMY